MKKYFLLSEKISSQWISCNMYFNGFAMNNHGNNKTELYDVSMKSNGPFGGQIFAYINQEY